MEPTQLVIVISLTAVTLIVVIIGIWLVMLLSELKNTLTRVNLILDDTHQITNSVAKPVSSFSEFLMGFKNGLSIFNSLVNRDKK